MMQELSCKHSKRDTNIAEEDIIDYNDAKYKYFLEVGIEYVELHDTPQFTKVTADTCTIHVTAER